MNSTTPNLKTIMARLGLILLVTSCQPAQPASDPGALPPEPAVESAAPAATVQPTRTPTGQTETSTAQPAPTGQVTQATGEPLKEPLIQEFPIPPGSRPHDVAPAPDGGVWYTGQGSGELGWLDPESGETRQIPLGEGSAPHGVIVGPDGAPWITDGGLNAIVRVDPASEALSIYPLPVESGYANLNTAAFDSQGVLWFTGQSGVYGRLDPAEGEVETFPAPRGRGPYGITATPNGEIYYASLAGSTSPESTRKPANQPSWNHPRPDRAHGGCGPIPRSASG